MFTPLFFSVAKDWFGNDIFDLVNCNDLLLATVLMRYGKSNPVDTQVYGNKTIDIKIFSWRQKLILITKFYTIPLAAIA